MHSKRPVWFIDIDGNINAVAHLNNSHYRKYPEWNKVTVNGYPILYATEVIDFINDMSDIVDIRWATTWRDRADSMFAPAVGLKKFPYEDSIGTYNPSGAWNGTNHLPTGRWWKQNIIMNHIENDGAPFIWTDDDIFSGVRKYIKDMADTSDVANCIVTPHETIGLAPAHLKRIKDFVLKNV